MGFKRPAGIRIHAGEVDGRRHGHIELAELPRCHPGALGIADLLAPHGHDVSAIMSGRPYIAIGRIRRVRRRARSAVGRGIHRDEPGELIVTVRTGHTDIVRVDAGYVDGEVIGIGHRDRVAGLARLREISKPRFREWWNDHAGHLGHVTADEVLADAAVDRVTRGSGTEWVTGGRVAHMEVITAFGQIGLDEGGGLSGGVAG